jgi:hypothetical protein
VFCKKVAGSVNVRLLIAAVDLQVTTLRSELPVPPFKSEALRNITFLNVIYKAN